MNHHAYSPNALVATKGKLNFWDHTGKNTHKTRDTSFTNNNNVDIQQAMQHANGVQKGIKTILNERNLWPASGKNSIGQKFICDCNKCEYGVTSIDRPDDCCARHLLSMQPDFLNQKIWLEEIIDNYNTNNEGRDYLYTFLPKFHCELNYIEYYWATLKYLHRSHNNKNLQLQDFLKALPAMMDEAAEKSSIKMTYTHCLRFMEGYRLGLKGPALDYAVRNTIDIDPLR